MGTRWPDICERFAAQLRADGVATFAAYLDLADPRSIDQFVKSADYLIGAVDVLVSAAGLADGSWVGAQHLAAQVIPSMIDRGCGDVVLVSPELIGPCTAMARRMLARWVAGLDAEFVGTGLRASTVRSTGTDGARVAPDEVGRLIASAIRAHLRVVDIIPSGRENANCDGITREMRC